MPKVSVLMSAYNSGKYIAEAIESILNQTFSDFEFIIVNDGSTDDTADVIKKYAAQDSRIIFIDNKQNRGLVPCLNQGLELCRGEYIARMDSDDIAMPDRFEIEINYLDNNPDVGVVGGWHERFGENITPSIRQYPCDVRLLDMLIMGAPVSHPTAMIRASILRDNDIQYNDFPYAEDYDIWSQILKYAQIHNLPRVMARYRWHDANVSVTAHKKQIASKLAIQNDIIKHLTDIPHIAKHLYVISHETNRSFYLFGILPIIRKKQYDLTKTKYYLFGKIPLLRVQNNILYLFDCIPVGKIKKSMCITTKKDFK